MCIKKHFFSCDFFRISHTLKNVQLRMSTVEWDATFRIEKFFRAPKKSQHTQNVLAHLFAIFSSTDLVYFWFFSVFFWHSFSIGGNTFCLHICFELFEKSVFHWISLVLRRINHQYCVDFSHFHRNLTMAMHFNRGFVLILYVLAIALSVCSAEICAKNSGFKCHSDKKCIDRSLTCNGAFDCDDRSDEENCSEWN